MPEAVTYVLAYASSSAGVAIGSTALTVAGYAITAAAVVSYGKAQQRKQRNAARNAYNASLQDRLQMTSLADGRRSRVYGRVRNVDGVVFKATHGTNKEFYTLVISLAGHEVDAIETVYFNEVAVTLDASGYVQTAPWSGAKPVSRQTSMTVTSGAGSVTLSETPIAGSVSVVVSQGSGDSEATYSGTPSVVGNVVSVSGMAADGVAKVSYQVSVASPKARVRKYLGGPAQNLYTDLNALVGSVVQSSDKFANDASLICTFEYDQDAFPTGLPTVSAVLRGAKCTDPRTGTTAWTENPAVIARDWALYAYGGGASTGELTDAAFIAAANACDVSTTFTTDVGSETRPLYQCGIVCPLDANPDETLDEIVESMAGQWGWAGGKLTVRAGVYRSPVATITEDWVTDAAAIQIVGQAPTSDLINVMRPSFADAAQNYVGAPAAEVRNTAAITADGRELPAELELRGVTRAVHAQHVCGVLMREGREALTLTLPCNLRAWQLELFDVVNVTLPEFGFSAKPFEVLGWDFSAAGGVTLSLRETASAIYTPDATFDTLDVAPNTNLPNPTLVEQVTGVTVTSGSTSAERDTSVLVRATVTWAAVVDQGIRQSGRIEVQYCEAAQAMPSSDWPAAPPVPGSATSTVITGLRAGIHYLFRVRAVNTLGVAGPWSDQKLKNMALAPASTRITPDVHDFAGASFTESTVRTITLTPQFDCDIEVTATLMAQGVLGDSGWFAQWTVYPTAGGGGTTVAAFGSASSSKSGLTAQGVYAATGGVSIDFKLELIDVPGSTHVFNLWESSIRITEVYR